MSTMVVERALALPAGETGPALLAPVEDQWFERKSRRISARALADAFIGMANADGGVVVVGLSDGVVEGTNADARRRNEHMQASVDFCVPPVRVRAQLVPCLVGAVEDQLLAFTIEPSETVHASVRDEVFLRVGDENRRLTFAQRQELLYDKGQATYETRRVDAGIDDVDAILVNQYAEAVAAPDPIRLLNARGLIVDGALTVAGCLLFSEHPQRLLPESFIRILRYRGRERGTGSRQQLVDDIKLEGPLPSLLIEASSAAERLQPFRQALQPAGRFGPVALIPRDAWLEGLVNAAIHRSYSMAGDHIRVEIFDDRIEISSPGRFPGLVDPQRPFDATRFARNPRVARVCADLQFGQELGEGIRRMFEEMRQAGLGDPLYRQTSGSVQLTLSAEPADRKLDARLPPRTRAITGALRDAGRLSTGEIAEAIGASRPVAQRELATLQEAGLVRWVGKSPKDPRAYWELSPT